MRTIRYPGEEIRYFGYGALAIAAAMCIVEHWIFIRIEYIAAALTAGIGFVLTARAMHKEAERIVAGGQDDATTNIPSGR